MLRPEQISLAQVPASDVASHPLGKVVEVDFGGSVCTVTVHLLDGDNAGGGMPLVVRTSYIDAPPVGALVRITVMGEAHVFEG
jgi:iron(III) transport system ATP-binding protein